MWPSPAPAGLVGHAHNFFGKWPSFVIGVRSNCESFSLNPHIVSGGDTALFSATGLAIPWCVDFAFPVLALVVIGLQRLEANREPVCTNSMVYGEPGLVSNLWKSESITSRGCEGGYCNCSLLLHCQVRVLPMKTAHVILSVNNQEKKTIL